LKIRGTALPVDQSFGSGNSSPMVKSSVAPGATAKILQCRPQPPAGTLERTRGVLHTAGMKRQDGELHAAASLFKCGAHVSRIAAVSRSSMCSLLRSSLVLSAARANSLHAPTIDNAPITTENLDRSAPRVRANSPSPMIAPRNTRTVSPGRSDFKNVDQFK